MLAGLLARLRAQPSRTGSLIITLYGDAIAPRGGAMWLGSLLALFNAMGVRDGVVRTAMSRLAAEGWLTRLRQGRNSFYRLDGAGLAQIQAAAPSIYAPVVPEWDGHLRVVLLDGGEARAALLADGYSQAAPGVLIALHPPTILPADALLLDATADAATTQRLAERAWGLAALNARYAAFLAAFPAQPGPLSPQDALLARLLLIHEFRRLALRDPNLPTRLLPPDWHGAAARARCAAWYAALLPASEAWLDQHGRAPCGPLPPADGTAAARFA